MAQHQLTCAIVTPDGALFEGDIESVVLPAWDGEMGVYPSHAPLVGKLGIGELRVRAADGTRRFFVEGGFVEILDNTVTILPNRALAQEDIDAAEVEKELEEARQAPVTGSIAEIGARNLALARAKAKLRIASNT